MKGNKPVQKVAFGNVSLLCWENKNSSGELFNSFSLNKTVMKRNNNDCTEFSGKVFSLNGLTKHDLQNVKLAISEMEDSLSEDGLRESG